MRDDGDDSDFLLDTFDSIFIPLISDSTFVSPPTSRPITILFNQSQEYWGFVNDALTVIYSKIVAWKQEVKYREFDLGNPT